MSRWVCLHVATDPMSSVRINRIIDVQRGFAPKANGRAFTVVEIVYGVIAVVIGERSKKFSKANTKCVWWCADGSFSFPHTCTYRHNSYKLFLLVASFHIHVSCAYCMCETTGDLWIEPRAHSDPFSLFISYYILWFGCVIPQKTPNEEDDDDGRIVVKTEKPRKRKTKMEKKRWNEVDSNVSH